MRILLFASLLSLLFGCASSEKEKERYKILSVKTYQDKVYASWIGQIIGNTYGLSYEFKYIDNPGPETFPYGYGWNLDELRRNNGAFSDDDTDIEYMYLNLMEKHGIEPSYNQLAEAWKNSVKTRVWCANRAAVTLMHANHFPPVTGMVKYNVQWCQIDPQLVNEIWAITAPGMQNYSVEKSEFAARITSDSIGLEPTLYYAAMFSAAFFESDVNKLVDIGIGALKPTSHFAHIVNHVKELYKKYPSDWHKARQIVKQEYYDKGKKNNYSWVVVDANLNGALGVMALLYGQGDFQKTLDLCCALGMDCDNQAATMCGLLGVANGLESIPQELLFPLKELNWEKPFNNSYKMITREGLKDDSLTHIGQRISRQGERVILSNGGKIIDVDGNKCYQINSDAHYIAPFELNQLPTFHVEKGKYFEYPIYTGGRKGSVQLFTEGTLPKGIELSNTSIGGVPSSCGDYSFIVGAKCGSDIKKIKVSMVVHSSNLATSATKVLYNLNGIRMDNNLLSDGETAVTYYSVKADTRREIDYYGYEWDSPKVISVIIYNNGAPNEFAGWFTSLDVEYLKEGEWIRVANYEMTPSMNFENIQWLKPSCVDYTISFPPIQSTGVRIVGQSGGIEKDLANAHLGLQYYSSISELKVFSR